MPGKRFTAVPPPRAVSAASLKPKEKETRPIAGPIIGGLVLLVIVSIAVVAFVKESAPASPRPGAGYVLDLGGGVSMTFVWIPPGSFEMGSNDGSADERPVHGVTIEAGFWLGETEVTQAQYRAVTGDSPSRFSGDALPVENVSWDAADSFCKRLSGDKGLTIRLPSEAEWEYACRAESKTRFQFSDSDAELGVYAWYTANAGGTTHPVRTRDPNAWGLHDMHGNVWEWCADLYHPSYEGAPTDGRAWVTGVDSYHRVLRGGSWNYDPRDCRSAYRYWRASDLSLHDFGFRVCLDP